MHSIIAPFKATYYNPVVIGKLSKVVCPPYDVMTKEQLYNFRKKSPYNFSHILLSLNSNYKKQGRLFKRWLENKILIDDDEEAIYLYEQEFSFNRISFKRYGIISLLCMDRKDLIMPHEYTLTEPKRDRRKIIEEVNANLTPIFTVVPKTLKLLKKIYFKYLKDKPFLQTKDYDNNLNRVWKISNKEDIDKISKEITNQKVLIADGHHRFEVAYEFYNEKRNYFKNLNYILAYITDLQKGLLVLPTHRIFSVPSDVDFFKKLENYFYIKNISKNGLLSELKKRNIFSFGVYKSKKFYFLKLKDLLLLDKIPEINVYKNLDSYILEKILPEYFENKEKFLYSHNLEEAITLAGDNKVVFILKSVDLNAIFEIVNKGFRLPQKTTYFYPKITSGLLLRRFERI